VSSNLVTPTKGEIKKLQKPVNQMIYRLLKFLRCQNKLFKTVVNVNKTVKHINNLNINRLQT